MPERAQLAFATTPLVHNTPASFPAPINLLYAMSLTPLGPDLLSHRAGFSVECPVKVSTHELTSECLFVLSKACSLAGCINLIKVGP